MRLPSSSSLLLASLASSSSLSALAAPTGDCPEGSSSPASASLNHDDTSNNNPQSRGLLNGALETLPPINAIIGGIIGSLYGDEKHPRARAELPLNDPTKLLAPLTDKLGGGRRRAAPADESGETDSPQDSSSPADADADPDGSEQSPATPAAPSPPAPPKLPVKAPVPLPNVPFPAGAPAPPGAPAGRRDTGDVVAVVAELMSPPPPRNPPNTPVQRELPISIPVPVKLPAARFPI